MPLLSKKEEAEERLRTMARHFARADRALANDPRLTCKIVNKQATGAPAWSSGSDITFNVAHIGDVSSIEDIIRLTGLNYHELAHVLYTPRKGTVIARHAEVTGNWASFNILEDQRIETMMCGLWPAVEPYFVSAFMRYIANEVHQWPQTLPLSHGRRYLPQDMRDVFSQLFEKPEIQTDIEEVIDEYRLLTFPADEHRAKYLVSRFGDLLRDLQQVPTDPHGHIGGGRPEISEGQAVSGAEQQQIAQKGQEREEERDQQDGQGGSGGQSDDDADSGSGQSLAPDKGNNPDQAAGNGKGSQDGMDGDGTPSDSSGDEGGEDSSADGSDQDGAGGADDSEDDQQGGNDPADGDAELDQQGGNKAGIGGHENIAPDPNDIGQVLKRMQDHIHAAENNSEVIADARQKRNTILKGDGKFDGLINDAQYSRREVNDDMQRAAKKFAVELGRVIADMDPGWSRHKSSGRVNVGRAMRGDDLDSVFDQWEEGNNQAADVEMVILVDMSSSMTYRMDAACQAMWIAKRGVEATGGTVSVYAYSSAGYGSGGYNSRETCWLLYGRDEKAEGNRYRAVRASGGTEPTDAIEEAARTFYASRRTHKIFMNITDGAWDDQARAEQWIDKINSAGILTALVYLTDNIDPRKIGTRDRKHTHNCGIYHQVASSGDLVTFAKSIVKATMRQRHR